MHGAYRPARRFFGRCVRNNHQLAILSTFPHFRTFVQISCNFFSRHQFPCVHPSSDSAPFLRSPEQCYMWLLHVLLFWRTCLVFPCFVCIMLCNLKYCASFDSDCRFGFPVVDSPYSISMFACGVQEGQGGQKAGWSRPLHRHIGSGHPARQ